MSKLPLVSVCIPVYNREKFIKNAIESVLQQTYQNFEIIVVDDGSTDSSISIVESFSDQRIKLFRNEINKGVVFTRNKYLKEASGDYIAILDSDDVWLPTKLEKQIIFFNENHEYGICGSWALRKYSTGKEEVWKYPTTDEKIRVRLLWGSSIVHSSMIIKNKILDNYSISYSKNFDSVEDYDIIRQVIKHSKAYNIGEALIIYNIHGNQITEEDNEEQVLKSVIVGENYLKDLNINFSEEERKAYKQVYMYKFNLNISQLHALKGLFKKILDTVENQPKLNLKEFKDDLSERWFLACYFSSHHGISTMQIFNSAQKDFLCNISIFQKAKFYLKCIIKK